MRNVSDLKGFIRSSPVGSEPVSLQAKLLSKNMVISRDGFREESMSLEILHNKKNLNPSMVACESSAASTSEL